MSREQLTDQQPEQDAGASVAAANGDIYGLPPHLYGQIKSLRYGDAEGLKLLLDLHHEFSKQILGVASSHIGLSATKKAMAMRTGNTAPINEQAHADVGNIAGDAFQPTPGATTTAPAKDPQAQGGVTPLNDQAHADIRHIAGDAFDPAPAATAAAPAKASEPPWVAGARKFNKVHAETVAEFNSLTNNACALDGVDNDPLAIAAWQAKNGLVADGKVGPHTLATARKVTAQAGPAGAASDARVAV